jgi:murein DD-endopeptidase MepM/ murein hydrolase activator NlpD
MKRIDESSPSAAPGAVPPDPPAPCAPPRLIGTIVDPAVREDGRGDPQLVLHAAVASGAEPSSSVSTGTGHPVRDRLLAKARAASLSRAGGGAEPSESAAPPRHGSERPRISQVPAARREPTPPEPERDSLPASPSAAPTGVDALPRWTDDLDSIGAPAPRRAARAARPSTALPPAAALLLGTLFGVTGLAVSFAVLIQVAPHEPIQTRSVAAPPEVVPISAPAPVAQARVRRAPRQPIPGPWRIADAGDDPQFRRVESSVGASSFLAVIQSAGVSLRDAYRVLTAFDGLKDLNRCRPRDSFSALLDAATGRLNAFEYHVSDEEVYQAREGKDGLLDAQRLDLKLRRERVEGAIVLTGGFEESAVQAGFEPGLTDAVNKALAGYVNVNEMKPGDALLLVAQELTLLGQFSRYAGVEAVEYRPFAGEPLRVYYHESEKRRGYVDARGRGLGKSRWARPVAGASVTSRFNPKRRHPILKRIKPHNGTDFGAAVGTPVLAAASGRVSFVGKAGPNGNMIRLQHAGGYETGYSHLSRFAKGLKTGARVDQRQLIGYVGSTGRSTGPHLHFSAKRQDRFIDPESLNLDALSPLAAAERQLLSQLRQRYDPLLNAIPIVVPPPRQASESQIASAPPAMPASAEVKPARLPPTPERHAASEATLQEQLATPSGVVPGDDNALRPAAYDPSGAPPATAPAAVYVTDDVAHDEAD